MIGFNELLRHEGIDPAKVKLARHQDRRGKRTPYDLWHPEPEKNNDFELYQSIQGVLKFKGADFIASFVVEPLSNKTLFVGLYRIIDVGPAPSGLKDPLSERDCGGENLYHLELTKKLSEYLGRLVIEWGAGMHAWVQLADKQNKSVLEIRESYKELSFPGYLDFKQNLTELTTIPVHWMDKLSSARGIYLLVHPDNGKQYVGSATGEHGFWERWANYVATGHGGNKRMQDIPAANYQVSILEVASSSADELAIWELEKRWKEKLRSKKFGLNPN